MTETTERGALRAALAEAAPRLRADLLAREVRAQLAAILETTPEAIGIDAGFASLGLASRHALALRDRLEHALGERIAITAVMDYPTVRGIAEYLSGKLFPAPAEAPAEVPSEAKTDPMSLDELEALLEAELEGKGDP